jgi:cytochrome c biogenesis protein CcmG/thiol:disulfide interchange protein DsbE
VTKLVAAVASACLASTVLTGCTLVTGEQQPLPSVDVVEFGSDEPVDVGGLRGPMVINLWASWCSSCREEMPVLEEFHRQHGDEVAVVGIDFQETQPDAAAELVADTGVSYRLLADRLGDLNGADPLPNIQGLPLQVLVDEDGEVAYMAYQPFESVEEIEEMVGDHLGVDL